MASHFMQEMLEEIATSLLRPNFPVVSLKKLRYQVREELLQRQELLFPSTLSDAKIDQEDVKELVYSLVGQGKLQREEYRKNRIDLFNKERIGLNFAIQRGCDSYLDQGDYNFYYNLFMPTYESKVNKQLSHEDSYASESSGLIKSNLDSQSEYPSQF